MKKNNSNTKIRKGFSFKAIGVRIKYGKRSAIQAYREKHNIRSITNICTKTGLFNKDKYKEIIKEGIKELKIKDLPDTGMKKLLYGSRNKK
jgi:hypothetical protein